MRRIANNIDNNSSKGERVSLLDKLKVSTMLRRVDMLFTLTVDPGSKSEHPVSAQFLPCLALTIFQRRPGFIHICVSRATPLSKASRRSTGQSMVDVAARTPAKLEDETPSSIVPPENEAKESDAAMPPPSVIEKSTSRRVHIFQEPDQR